MCLLFHALHPLYSPPYLLCTAPFTPFLCQQPASWPVIRHRCANHAFLPTCCGSCLLFESYSRVPFLLVPSPPFDPPPPVYSRLYQKPANYELPEDDVRQLTYELETQYNTLMRTLRSK